MAQHDMDIANASGASVRADLNLALAAIVSNNSGATAPSVMFANMWWFDTASNLLMQRNEANSAWVAVAGKSGGNWTPYWNTALADAFFQERFVGETALSTTSGTAHGFTGINAGTNRIVMALAGVSLSGTDNLLIQLGDAGGYETTGYVSSSTSASDGADNIQTSTAGFTLKSLNAGVAMHGTVDLHRIDGNQWVCSYSLRGHTSATTSGVISGGGSKTLSDELTQVRLLRSGSDTFDAGKINIFTG